MKDAHSLRVEDLLKHIQNLRKKGKLQDLDGELPPLELTQKKNEFVEARPLQALSNAETLSIVKKPIIDTKVEAAADTVSDTTNIDESSSHDTQNDYYEKDVNDTPEKVVPDIIESVGNSTDLPIDQFQASPKDPSPSSEEPHSNSLMLEQMLAETTAEEENYTPQGETMLIEEQSQSKLSDISSFS